MPGNLTKYLLAIPVLLLWEVAGCEFASGHLSVANAIVLRRFWQELKIGNWQFICPVFRGRMEMGHRAVAAKGLGGGSLWLDRAIL
jgi:hypothetical protein